MVCAVRPACLAFWGTAPRKTSPGATWSRSDEPSRRVCKQPLDARDDQRCCHLPLNDWSLQFTAPNHAPSNRSAKTTPLSAGGRVRSYAHGGFECPSHDRRIRGDAGPVLHADDALIDEHAEAVDGAAPSLRRIVEE